MSEEIESKVHERRAELEKANEPLPTQVVEQRRAEEELRLLIAITQAITQCQDFDSAISTTLKMVCESACWDYGEAWVPQADGTALECSPAWCQCRKPVGQFRTFSEGLRFLPSVGLPGRVWASKQAEWVVDISTALPSRHPRAEMALRTGLKASVGVPIVADDQVLTVLVFFSFEFREEDRRQVDLALAVAAQLGTVLQHKRMEEALRRAREDLEIRVQERTAELAKANEALKAEIVERKRVEDELATRHRDLLTLHKISEITLSTHSLETAFQEIVEEISVATAFPAVVIELYDEARQKMLFKGIKGISLPSGERILLEVPVNETLSGIVVRTGQPMVETNAWERPEYAHKVLRELGCRTFVCVPMRDSKKVIGVLSLASPEVMQLHDGFLQMVTELANHVASLIQRKKAEDWLHSLIDTTQDAVVSIDREGRIVQFNPAAERIFGYTRAEVEGQKVNMVMAEPYASEHDEYISRYERTGEARAIGRIRTVQARRKNGETFPIELSVAEVKTDREVSYSAFIRDISEKVKLQERLMEEGKLAAVGATASKLAHEIGNPLNGMYMQVQAVEQRLIEQNLKRAETVQEIRSKMRSLRGEITRLHGLLDEFSSLSRREKYSFRPTELSGLVAQVIEIETEYYRAHRIKVQRSFPSELPPIHADPERLKQVFVNLFKNAAEAMPQGGELTVQGSQVGNQVILEIIDTGVGIAPGVAVFEPFVTTKAKGTGLGLMIVRQIILAHQGTIAYTSEVGKGTALS